MLDDVMGGCVGVVLVKLRIRFWASTPARMELGLVASGGASASSAENRSTLEDMTDYLAGSVATIPFRVFSERGGGTVVVVVVVVASDDTVIMLKRSDVAPTPPLLVALGCIR